jgi:hypothetical protein
MTLFRFKMIGKFGGGGGDEAWLGIRGQGGREKK